MASPKKEKKSLFASFQKKDGPPKVKKEKRTKKEKAPKNPNASNKNIFGKMKKKPRAEYQAEIDALQSQLAETQMKYEQLQRWASNPPVAAY